MIEYWGQILGPNIGATCHEIRWFCRGSLW